MFSIQPYSGSAACADGFRAVCLLIETGKNKGTLSDPLLRRTYEPGLEKELLRLCARDDLPGYGIWSKRLEQGQFVVRSGPGGKRQLNWTQLKLLLDGIEIKKSRQYKRYSRPS